MRAAIVLGRDLDVFVAFPPVWIAILDAQIGEVDLVIEAGEVVFVCPIADLLVSPIRMPVVVGPTAIPLVKPALVLTLELVVEHNAFDPRATLRQALRSAFVSAIDLEVVFALPFAFEAMPERLTPMLAAVAMAFEEAPPLPR